MSSDFSIRHAKGLPFLSLFLMRPSCRLSIQELNALADLVHPPLRKGEFFGKLLPREPVEVAAVDGAVALCEAHCRRIGVGAVLP